MYISSVREETLLLLLYIFAQTGTLVRCSAPYHFCRFCVTLGTAVSLPTLDNASLSVCRCQPEC